MGRPHSDLKGARTAMELEEAKMGESCLRLEGAPGRRCVTISHHNAAQHHCRASQAGPSFGRSKVPNGRMLVTGLIAQGERFPKQRERQHDTCIFGLPSRSLLHFTVEMGFEMGGQGW